MLSVSRWFVGSSSSKTSGRESSSAASAMRIFQPPENSLVRRLSSRSGRKPRPLRTWRASTSKPKPPWASNSRWSRSCSEQTPRPANPRRARPCGAPPRPEPGELLQTSAALQIGHQRQVVDLDQVLRQITDIVAVRHRDGAVVVFSAPAITRSAVVLPAPLSPTSPTRLFGVTNQRRPRQGRPVAESYLQTLYS